MRAHYSNHQFEEANCRVTSLPSEESDQLHQALENMLTEVKPGYFLGMYLDRGLLHQTEAYVLDDFVVGKIGAGIWCDANRVQAINELTELKTGEEHYFGFQPVGPGDEVVFRIVCPRQLAGYPLFRHLLIEGLSRVFKEAPDYFKVANGEDPKQVQDARCESERLALIESYLDSAFQEDVPF